MSTHYESCYYKLQIGWRDQGTNWYDMTSPYGGQPLRYRTLPEAQKRRDQELCEDEMHLVRFRIVYVTEEVIEE